MHTWNQVVALMLLLGIQCDAQEKPKPAVVPRHGSAMKPGGGKLIASHYYGGTYGGGSNGYGFDNSWYYPGLALTATTKKPIAKLSAKKTYVVLNSAPAKKKSVPVNTTPNWLNIFAAVIAKRATQSATTTIATTTKSSSNDIGALTDLLKFVIQLTSVGGGSGGGGNGNGGSGGGGGGGGGTDYGGTDYGGTDDGGGTYDESGGAGTETYDYATDDGSTYVEGEAAAGDGTAYESSYSEYLL